MVMMVIVFIITKVFLFVLVFAIDSQIVLVKMKHPHHKKHEQQTGKANPKRNRRAFQNINRMRQQMKKRDSQHDAGNKAENQLDSLMCEFKKLRNRTTKQRGDRNNDAIGD